MRHVSDFQADWMRELKSHASTLNLIQRRIDPLESELDTLYSKMDDHLNDKPTWHDCVIEPILREIREVFVVRDLHDRSKLRYPLMIIAPRQGQTPAALTVVFTVTDKSTGGFQVDITGYTPEKGQIEKQLKSNNSMTVEQIIRQIGMVRDQL